MYYADLMRNETLDSIYHPTLTLVENRLFDVMFPFSIIMFIFTLYVVATKSTVSMRHYKHILIFEIFSSYSFDIVWFLWRPNLLWPMRAAILTGPMGNITPYTFQILYGAFLFDVSTVATSQIIQFVFRVSTTLQSENLLRKVMTTKLSYMYACSLAIFAFFIVMLMSPVFLNIIDPKESQRLFIEDFPPLQKLVDEYPNLSGYHPELTNISLELLLDAGMVLILMVPVFAFLGVMLFVHRMKLMRVLESKKTYEMHVMLLHLISPIHLRVFPNFVTLRHVLLLFQIRSHLGKLSSVIVDVNRIIPRCGQLLLYIVVHFTIQSLYFPFVEVFQTEIDANRTGISTEQTGQIESTDEFYGYVKYVNAQCVLF
uniref:G protein-coupled receptor n=1 Tax=Panagrellus redivivus TaxID=6233 RepID=A0A7E4W520_PANRE